MSWQMHSIFHIKVLTIRLPAAGRHQRKSGSTRFAKNKSVSGTTKMPNKGTEWRKQRPKSEPSTWPTRWGRTCGSHGSRSQSHLHYYCRPTHPLMVGWLVRWELETKSKVKEGDKEEVVVGWWAENEEDSVRANCVRKTISPGLIRRTLDVRGGPSLIDLQPPVVTSIQWTAFDFRPRSDGLGKCVYGTSMEIERPLNSLLYAWQADFCPKVIYSPVHPRLIRMSTTTSMMTMMMMDPSSALSQLNINHMSNFLCSFLIFHFFFFLTQHVVTACSAMSSLPFRIPKCPGQQVVRKCLSYAC